MGKAPIDMLDTFAKTPGRGQQGTKVRRRSAEVLGRVPLFSGLTRRHLHQLADTATEVSFRQGGTVIREGDLGETLFVVLEGQAKVTRGGRKINTLGPGDFFGEISLIDRGPRTATVVAETPLITVRLFRRDFLKLLEREPKLAEKVLLTLAGRLRTVEKSLTS
jgi:CRP/FNR family transcriptional regulator, cyclic AMP receptor protein